MGEEAVGAGKTAREAVKEIDKPSSLVVKRSNEEGERGSERSNERSSERVRGREREKQ